MYAKTNLISCTAIGAQKYELKLSLCWSGSWKNEINCDGIYLFAKDRADGTEPYQSLKLSTASSGEFDYTDKLPADCHISGSNVPTGGYVPENAVGIFVFPTDLMGKSDVKIDEITLTVCAEKEPKSIELFAVEMVYIPEGAHYVGDPGNGIRHGGTLKNCFYCYPNNGAYLINAEDAIEFAPEDGHLYCDRDTPNARAENDRFTIPTEFPKGYRALWCMKYNLSEQQFVQFMNCLTRRQQQGHCDADISGETIDKYFVVTGTVEPKDRCEVFCNRYGNTLGKPLRFYTAAPFRAMNGISHYDVMAFAAFAGLRPMTELEYEKVCRGTLPAVQEEFAWGSTKIGRVFHFDGADGSGTEKPIAQTAGAVCNCNFGTDIPPFEAEFKKIPDNPGWSGPVSIGLYERSEPIEGYTERERTGATYYGVMDMCGNVWENLVTTGRPAGRSYIPAHGNGELDADGLHMVSEWKGITTADGFGVRGGVFVSPGPAYVHMALRVFGAHPKDEKRYHGGIRVGF